MGCRLLSSIGLTIAFSWRIQSTLPEIGVYIACRQRGILAPV